MSRPIFKGIFGLAALCSSLAACGAATEPATRSSPAAYPSDRSTNPDFARHWRDGKAEMNGYRVLVRRYGEDRIGEGVMIYVTEPFSISGRVKLDEPSLESDDAVEVLKLNFVIDFQTGLYDYNTMTSTFSRTDDFTPLKSSFSSAEWCGHVYDELIFHPGYVSETYRSYFEGESSETDLPYPTGGMVEDNLFIQLRGLGEDFLAPGESRTVPFLPSAFHRRLAHKESGWTRAEVSRATVSEEIAVPAGKFAAHRYTVRTEDGRIGNFLIEAAYPHRVVRWDWSPGEASLSGELTGSARMAYWKLNSIGAESRLEELGLKPSSAR